MILLVSVWLVLWALCLGLGVAAFGLAFRFGGGGFRVLPRPSQLVWLGLALLLALLQLVSLFGPVGPAALVGAGVLALSSLYRSRPLVRVLMRGLRRRGARVVVVQLAVVVALLVLVSNSALQATSWYDTISTHIQQVKWAHLYGTPLGLGNLNPKLGFDQAHHLLAAALSVGPLAHHVCHSAVPFFAATLVVDWALTLTAACGSASRRLEHAFVLLMAPYVAGKLWTEELASLSGDLAMASLLLPAVRELLRIGATLRRARRLGWELLVFGALSGALFAVKFSAMPVTVTAVLLFVVLGVRRRGATRGLVFAALPLVVLLAATLARRIMVTGWLLYPIPFGNLHLPWSIPRAVTIEQYRWIKSWARLPGVDSAEVLDHGFFHWFMPWFDAFRQTREFIILCLGAVACVVRALAAERGTHVFRASRLAIVVAIACLVYWFVGAPDRRFGGVFIWLVPAVALAPFVATQRDFVPLLLCVVALTWWNEGLSIRLRDGTAMSADSSYSVRAKRFSNPDGRTFDVNVPVEHDVCGDAPLPCSPYFTTQKMKEPGNLARGFRP